MPKKIFSIMLFLLLMPIVLPDVSMASDKYDYEIVSQSDHPTIKQGETKLIWVKLKNTGSESWQPDNWIMPLEDKYGESCINAVDTYEEDIKGGCILPPPPTSDGVFRLGTIRPTDRNSGFMAEYDWISTNRVNANFWEEVRPGQTVTIGFNIFAPYNMVPGTYSEYFAPVIENITWMNDKNLHWDINVTPQDNDYSASVWSYYQTDFQLKAGQTTEVTYDVKNTGRETWYKNGSFPVHVATIEPKDRSSELFDSTSWISVNRPNGLADEEVKPGDMTTIKFTIKAPQKPAGTFISESFWLVAENKSWFAPGDYPSTSMDIKVEILDDSYVAIDMENSTITSDKEQVIADGQDSAHLTIDLIDTDGLSVTNTDLVLSAFGCTKTGLGCWQEEEVTLTTDTNGQAFYEATNDIESTITYSFRVGEQYSYASLTLDFYTIGHEYIEFANTSTDKTSISISQKETATVKSTLQYKNSDPVPMYYVEVIIDDGTAAVGGGGFMPASIWTDSDGRVSYKIDASDYQSGDELKARFQTSPLPPSNYDEYIQSQELTIKIVK